MRAPRLRGIGSHHQEKVEAEQQLVGSKTHFDAVELAIERGRDIAGNPTEPQWWTNPNSFEPSIQGEGC